MFGEKKFFFDCKTVERSEDTDRCQLRPDWVTSVTDHPATSVAGRHWDHWQTLCAHYSHRELTFPEDNLPAISGMASKIARKVESEYLAGLWGNNLVHDLFWQTTAGVTEPKRPKKYRAPSWSWASLDGSINWPYGPLSSSCSECKMFCSVLDVRTTPMGLDPYGAVKDGFLKVRGVYEQVDVRLIGGDRYQHPWRLHHQGKEIGHVNLDIETDGMRVRDRENLYSALLVSHCKSREDSKPLVRGLLLEKNGRKRQGHNEFERVGIFTLFQDVMWDRDVLNGDAEEMVMIV